MKRFCQKCVLWFQRKWNSQIRKLFWARKQSSIIKNLELNKFLSKILPCAKRKRRFKFWPSFRRPKFGILSWFDLAGLLLGLLMMIARVFSRPPPSPEDLRRRTILQLCLCAYLVGLVPAAFTLGCPHAIRTMGAWPFLMLAAGCFWEELIRRWAPAALLAVLLAGLFAKAHVGYYFKEYPARSAGMFAPWIRSTAESVHGPEDFLKLWYIAGNDYYYRYYVMLLYNRPCKGSFDEWFQIRDLMNRAGIKK